MQKNARQRMEFGVSAPAAVIAHAVYLQNPAHREKA